MDIKDLEKLPAEVQALKNGQRLVVIQMQEIHEKVDKLLLSKPVDYTSTEKRCFEHYLCRCSTTPTKPEYPTPTGICERTAWTEEHDKRLLHDFARFITAEAYLLQRTENAIKARLRTLQKDYHQYRSGR